jgi:hypothetical protein
VGIQAWRDRLGPETVLYNGTHETHGTNGRHLFVTPSNAQCLAHAVTPIHPPGSSLITDLLITDHWCLQKW